jgi:hypothetical protein
MRMLNAEDPLAARVNLANAEVLGLQQAVTWT